MADNVIRKKKFDGQDVDILGPTYEPGKPQGPELWRGKLGDRKQMLAYLKSAERYWFSDDWFGSEKRKKKA
ncbi:MAG: hypothetical protein HY897_25945 [Deltaproteobacteria bacterium]|nr:hypothetical protein [Deltaproteobacteria bacterium]